jgi:hypothetical protein
MRSRICTYLCLLLVLGLIHDNGAFFCLNVGVHGFAPVSLTQRNAPVSAWLTTKTHHTSTATVLFSAETTQGSNSNAGRTTESTKLSRPERKAAERLKKEQKHRRNSNHRKHNFAERENQLIAQRKKGEGQYDLHSNHVSRLTKDSTADEVMTAIKRAQNLHDHHDIQAIEDFLLNVVDESFAYGYRGSLLSRLAVAALHMSDHTLARKAINERRTVHRSTMLPLESAALIRGLLRVHNVTDAIEVLDDELSLPFEVRMTYFSPPF